MNTLLFDLDGTLLPMDLDVFMKVYFKKLIPYVRHVLNPERVVPDIWNATEAMIANEDAARTNEQVFKDVFFSTNEAKEEEVWPAFESFYANVFPELKEYTQPSPLAREICQAALKKGYQLAIATNPIFPELAIRHRLEWAEIGDIPFALITTMEGMHYCKPNPKYYMEILSNLDVSPKDAFMFGNDVQEDGVAGKVGMQTYLVTDNMIDHQKGHFVFDYKGTLDDVLNFVQNLPVVSV